MNRAGRDRYDDTGGAGGSGDRFRGMLARVFGDADNPMQWAITLGSVSGIRVRIHVIFIIYAIAQLLFAWISRDTLGLGFTAIMLSWLFVIVLLHEFGHCLACRWVGGEADDILMWPLGGLAFVRPPDTPGANLITTLGGPGVNAILLAPFVMSLLMYGMGDRILFNPLDINAALHNLSWAQTVLFLGHVTNLALLCFNMILCIYPLDSGRVLQELLWFRLGKRAATDIALNIGFVGAIALGVFGLVANQTILMGIALFCGVSCFLERRTLRAADELTSPWAESAMWREGNDEPAPKGPSKKELKQREREQAEQAELDRVLEKIAKSGMDSLTKSERKTLETATKKRQKA
jgi:Zn-dependent protease